MTQPNLLEQAKQGDPQAIAALMNRSLHPKGIAATVTRQGNRLRVLLEAEQVPNRQAMTTFVRNGLMSLKVPNLEAIEILGRQLHSDQPAWIQDLHLEPTPPVKVAAPPPPPPTPPPRPTPLSVRSRPVPPPPKIAESERVESEVRSRSGLTLEDIYADSTPEVAGSALSPAAPPIAVTGYSPATPEMPDRSIDIDESIDSSNQRAAQPAAIVIPAPADPIADSIVPAPRPRPAAPSFLVLAVSLLVLGWVGAIVGFALWSSNAPPDSDPIPSPATSPVAPTTPIAPTPTTSVTPSVVPSQPAASAAGSYQEALRRGTQARTLAQSAQSADDWSLVVSQWQQAIASLKAVPASSPDRAAAQLQLAEFQASLATAQQRAADQPTITNAPPPSTTFTVTRDITCPTSEAASGSQPVELSNVQFKPDAANVQSSSIVGCITNHTNQAITAISVSYQGSSIENPNLIESGFSALTFAELEPRRTAPFAGSFELSTGVTNLDIKAIYWTPPGTSEQQQIPTSVALTR